MTFFSLQILLNCGKQCHGTKARLNSQSLAGLQGSAQTVHLLSFLISDFFFGNPFLCPVACVTDTSRPAESTDPTLPGLFPKNLGGFNWQLMVTLTFPSKPQHTALHPSTAGVFRAGYFGARFSWGQLSTLSELSCPAASGPPV